MVWYPPVEPSVSLPEYVPEDVGYKKNPEKRNLVPGHAYYVIDKVGTRKYPTNTPVIICYQQSKSRCQNFKCFVFSKKYLSLNSG